MTLGGQMEARNGDDSQMFGLHLSQEIELSFSLKDYTPHPFFLQAREASRERLSP